MDRFRTYDGRRGTSRRRRHATGKKRADRSSRRAIKLFICAALFLAAAFLKLLFPSALAAIGEKINTVVNYKAALTSLGEGLSGEKKLTAALGEAITYAFTGEASAAPANGDETEKQGNASPSAAPSGDAGAVNTPASGDSVETFSEAGSTAAVTDTESGNEPLSNAVIAAFMKSQEEYSDYAIPAGATYDMPKMTTDYTTPVKGVVSSPFGYRMHPTEKKVKFHFGTDIAANKGTEIVAFANGKVIAAGESTSLGNYVIIRHGAIESEYAHCSKIYVNSGQTVSMGDKVAAVGDTGNATEACLHFELKVNGVCVNPEYYITW